MVARARMVHRASTGSRITRTRSNSALFPVAWRTVIDLRHRSCTPKARLAAKSRHPAHRLLRLLQHQRDSQRSAHPFHDPARNPTCRIVVPDPSPSAAALQLRTDPQEGDSASARPPQKSSTEAGPSGKAVRPRRPFFRLRGGVRTGWGAPAPAHEHQRHGRRATGRSRVANHCRTWATRSVLWSSANDEHRAAPSYGGALNHSSSAYSLPSVRFGHQFSGLVISYQPSPNGRVARASSPSYHWLAPFVGPEMTPIHTAGGPRSGLSPSHH